MSTQPLGTQPYSLVQLAVFANQAGRPDESVRYLELANLNEGEAVEIISALTQEMPDLDWRPKLTFFANEYPKNEIVWRLWVGLGTQLEKSERWNDALKWYLEGAKTQESINECLLCSVLYVRIGRIYQLRSEFKRSE